MKDIKELAIRIRDLHREYLQGKESSLEELQTLAWVAEIPVDFVQELLSLEEVPRKDAETYQEMLDAYSDALRELEELKQSHWQTLTMYRSPLMSSTQNSIESGQFRFSPLPSPIMVSGQRL